MKMTLAKWEIVKWVIIILVTTLVVAFVATPVFAIDDPDSPPQVNSVYVYEFDDGSIGVLIDYYLDYDLDEPPVGTGEPDEPVTDAYLAIFVDTDGVTQLKAVAPYTFFDNGYQRGLVYIPFTETEVGTYSLDSANMADYRIWFVGNPTLAWAGDPPLTITTIDQWNTTGDMAVLLALRVLYYADLLELIWSSDLIETTSVGSRLTTLGASYFENVIPSLRSIAPACFSSSTLQPEIEDIDYTTEFGAIATSAVLAGSPVTLSEGTNNLNPTGAGTIIFTLSQGTVGTVTGAVVTGSPLDIVAGTNTATITGAGAIVVEVDLSDTVTGIEGIITGTGFDLTTIATTFGMSRWMFGGIVWMILGVVICAATFRRSSDAVGAFGVGAATKTVMVVFDLWIIAGILLGLLHPIVGVLMFIGFGIFTGYILFFRQANA